VKKILSTVDKENGAITVREIKYLVGKPNPVILEIGANIGQTTLDFLKEIPESTIYCFEPDPRAIATF